MYESCLLVRVFVFVFETLDETQNILHVRVIYSTAARPGLLHKLIGKDYKDSFHLRYQRRVLHISWYNFVSNDEVLRRSGLFDVSYIVRKQRLGLFGHVARLQSDALANQILQICTKMRDGDRFSQELRCASGRPPTTWINQICRDTGVTAMEALDLAENKLFWRMIATAGRFG